MTDSEEVHDREHDPRCDFCSASYDHASYTYHTDPFTYTIGGTTVFDDGEWDACHVCSILLQENEWARLEDRAYSAFIHKHTLPKRIRLEIRQEIRDLYAVLRQGESPRAS